jgi:hypothetical protein
MTVRQKSVLTMAIGGVMFVGFGLSDWGRLAGYLGIAGWVIFVCANFWFGYDWLKRRP